MLNVCQYLLADVCVCVCVCVCACVCACVYLTVSPHLDYFYKQDIFMKQTRAAAGIRDRHIWLEFDRIKSISGGVRD